MNVLNTEIHFNIMKTKVSTEYNSSLVLLVLVQRSDPQYSSRQRSNHYLASLGLKFRDPFCFLTTKDKVRYVSSLKPYMRLLTRALDYYHSRMAIAVKLPNINSHVPHTALSNPPYQRIPSFQRSRKLRSIALKHSHQSIRPLLQGTLTKKRHDITEFGVSLRRKKCFSSSQHDCLDK